jgi:acetylornithine deacetylase/succinyl-diaminopimelate desuccinylase-like protein
LVDAAEGVLARQIALLQSLIACRTVSTPQPDTAFTDEAERALDLVTAELTDLGFAWKRWRTDDAFPTLAGRHATDGGGPVIGFNGHLDVVPIEDPLTWRHDSWGGAIASGRLYGRGACDAKGPVVAMFGALMLLRETGTAPATDLLLHLVTDEEVAGGCTDACLERGWPDAVIVGEPSALDVWIAEPGLEHVRVEVDGIATHALNRW